MYQEPGCVYMGTERSDISFSSPMDPRAQAQADFPAQDSATRGIIKKTEVG